MHSNTDLQSTTFLTTPITAEHRESFDSIPALLLLGPSIEYWFKHQASSLRCFLVFFSLSRLMFRIRGQTLQSWVRYVVQWTTYVAAVVYTTTKSSKCGDAILHNNIRGN